MNRKADEEEARIQSVFESQTHMDVIYAEFHFRNQYLGASFLETSPTYSKCVAFSGI